MSVSFIFFSTFAIKVVSVSYIIFFQFNFATYNVFHLIVNAVVKNGKIPKCIKVVNRTSIIIVHYFVVILYIEPLNICRARHIHSSGKLLTA